MIKKHHILYVPGLGDQKRAYDFLINGWSMYGVVPHVYRIGWRRGEKSFKPKLKKLVAKVNKYLDRGNVVSLVGGSAGGSAVLNALIEQPKINAVVNVCGRLRAGENVRPSLEFAARTSPSFKESVLNFEHVEPKMTQEERRKVLNLIPLYDEVVPKSTALLNGATNKTIPAVEHLLSGFLGMTLFSPMIMGFLKRKAGE